MAIEQILPIALTVLDAAYTIYRVAKGPDPDKKEYEISLVRGENRIKFPLGFVSLPYYLAEREHIRNFKRDRLAREENIKLGMNNFFNKI